MHNYASDAFSLCARDESAWSEFLSSGCLHASSAVLMLVPGPTVHAEPALCAFHARGGMHSADFSLAFATLAHGVFPALVAAASSMFKWAYASVSRAASFLAICLLKRAWFEHFNLYVVCGLLVQ